MKKSVTLLILAISGSICAAAQTAAAPAAAVAPAPQKAAPAAAVAPAPQNAAPAAAVAPAPQKAAPAAAVAPAPQKAEEPGVALCLARGLCNISTGWLELPRCMIYDNGFIPVFGLIIGIPEGALFTVGRTLCGVFDIISFGASGSTFHGKNFPDTVFQSKWNYRKN